MEQSFLQKKLWSNHVIYLCEDMHPVGSTTVSCYIKMILFLKTRHSCLFTLWWRFDLYLCIKIMRSLHTVLHTAAHLLVRKTWTVTASKTNFL